MGRGAARRRVVRGALSGLALGVKVSAAPATLVVAAMLALRARAQPIARGRAAATVALALGATWLATGGYWYLRNLVHTGNPVYPAAFLAWPGATFPETTLLEYARHYGLRRALGDAVVVYADWPRAHAALAALGLAGLAAGSGGADARYPRAGAIWPAAHSPGRPRPGLLPVAPYSAGNAMTFRSGFIHWDSMRYVALVPILGWIALGLLLDQLSPDRRGPVAIAIVVGAVLLASGVGLIVVVPLALAAWPLARRWPDPVGPVTPRRRALVATAVAAVAAAAVVGRHDAKAAATAATFIREPLYGAVVAVLDGSARARGWRCSATSGSIRPSAAAITWSRSGSIATVAWPRARRRRDGARRSRGRSGSLPREPGRGSRRASWSSCTCPTPAARPGGRRSTRRSRPPVARACYTATRRPPSGGWSPECGRLHRAGVTRILPRRSPRWAWASGGLDLVDRVHALDGRRERAREDLLAEIHVERADLRERARGQAAAQDEADQRLPGADQPGARHHRILAAHRAVVTDDAALGEARREAGRGLARHGVEGQADGVAPVSAVTRSARSGPSTAQPSAPSSA